MSDKPEIDFIADMGEKLRTLRRFCDKMQEQRDESGRKLADANKFIADMGEKLRTLRRFCDKMQEQRDESGRKLGELREAVVAWHNAQIDNRHDSGLLAEKMLALALAAQLKEQAMDSNNRDICEVWLWLVNHPAFLRVSEQGRMIHSQGFEASLDIAYAMVNPETRRVDDDESKNTKSECWLEAGPWRWMETCKGVGFSEWPSHDIDLDCGGDTFEDAIFKMRDLVLAKYGDYDVDYWDTDAEHLPHLKEPATS